MTTDEQTLTDSGTKTVQRTGRHSSRPDEVLFFPTAHFLFFNLSQPTLAHLPLPPTAQANAGQRQKSQISPAPFLRLSLQTAIEYDRLNIFKSIKR